MIGTGTTVASAIAGGSASDRQAAAQQRLAEARLREAKAARTAARRLALPSTAEIASLDRAFRDKERGLEESLAALKKEEAVLAQTDPVVQQAAQGLTNLLKGNQARLLEPVRRQRAKQRAQLENQLAATLGSGFRTSSAGQTALQNFDEQSIGITLNVQQSAISQLTQVLGTTAGIRRGFASSVAGVFESAVRSELGIRQARGDISRRQIAAEGVGLGAIIEGADPGAIGDISRAKSAGEDARAFGEFGAGLVEFGGEQLIRLAGRKKTGDQAPAPLSERIAGFDLGDLEPEFGAGLRKPERGFTLGTLGDR